MRVTLAILIVVGLVAALSTAILVGALRADFMSASMASVVQEEPEVNVVLAAMDLAAAEVLREDSVKVVSMPRRDAPKGSFTNPAQVVGRVLIQPMVSGQAFLPEAFPRSGSGYEVATKALPEGYRGYSITVSQAAGNEAAIYPGAVVDVMASVSPRGDAAQSVDGAISATLLHAVTVLAVDDRTVVSGSADQEERAGRARGQRTVMLMVDQPQAEVLHYASSRGANLTLVLRNPLDKEFEAPQGFSASDLGRILPRLRLDEPAVIEVASAEAEAPTGPTQEELDALRRELEALKRSQAKPDEPQEDPMARRHVDVLRGTAKETLEFEEDQEGARPRPVRR